VIEYPRDGSRLRGDRDWPLGSGRRWPGTAVPGGEEAPTPVVSPRCGTWKPRPGPGVRCPVSTPLENEADREEGPVPVRGASVQAVIARLNPIIRGWSAYYRTMVSSHTFTALDHYLWKLTCKWARHSHPNGRTEYLTRVNSAFCTLTATGITPGPARAQHFCPSASPRGLLEPDAWTRARPVLRGAGLCPEFARTEGSAA
jgi:hypothetical protein